MASVEELREAAKYYASKGMKVFPCMAGTKKPATQNGFKDATTDIAQIEKWWEFLPYNIAVAMGPESGYFVIDVDFHNGGYWDCPVQTLTARSGGRYAGFDPGLHYWFIWPKGVAKMLPKLRTGVDVQGIGHYIMVAPSVTDEAYEWIDFSAVAEAPLDLLAEVAIAEGAVIDERPGDTFNRTHTWEEILIPAGWSIDHEGADGETYWTRPGKDEGVSGTSNYQDSGLFYVFTTSTEFEAGRGYDKFGVFTRLHHNGDTSDAAVELAGEDSSPRLAASPAAPATSLPGVLTIGRGSDYSFTPAVREGHLIGQFIRYCTSVSDAPSEYAEAAVLSALAVLTSGMRVSLAHIPDGLRTNLFLCLVGASSVSRKSTIQQLAITMLKRLRPNALLPDRMTTESAINELGQRAVAVWTPDELGQTLQQVYRSGSYSQGLEEILLTIYSGQTYRYVTLGGGERVVENVDLSVFGAATPESLGSVSGRAIGSGLLPRFGLVYPTSRPPTRSPVSETPAMAAEKEAIIGRMREVLNLVTYPGNTNKVMLTPDALTTLSSMDYELGSSPMTSRLVMSAYKVAALVALGDLRTEVTAEDAGAAVIIIRRWANGAKNLRRFLGHSPQDVALMEQVYSARDELKGLVSTRERGVDGRVAVPKSEVAAVLRLPASTINKISDTLEMLGEVIVVKLNETTEWHIKP